MAEFLTDISSRERRPLLPPTPIRQNRERKAKMPPGTIPPYCSSHFAPRRWDSQDGSFYDPDRNCLSGRVVS